MANHNMNYIKKSLNSKELNLLLPKKNLRIIDLGPGDLPYIGRKDYKDEIITIDFDSKLNPTYNFDLTKEWPKEIKNIDFIYASHVIEHFYQQERDVLINKLHNVLNKDGLLFIRVPHAYSFQGFGWEHYSQFTSNGFFSLVHGRNKNFPKFDMILNALSSIQIQKFHKPENLFNKNLDYILNLSHRITDMYISRYFGCINEVQCLLKKPF
jgi:predicted SAM-dependent methyltransferase